MDVTIPKPRSGSYFPDWLRKRRKRTDRALISMAATCYLPGVGRDMIESAERWRKAVDSTRIRE